MKRYLICTIASLTIGLLLLSIARPRAAHAQAPSTCTPPPPGLVSWWLADGGNANDIIGGNDGNPVGVVFTQTTCPSCTCQLSLAFSLNAEIVDPASHVQGAITAPGQTLKFSSVKGSWTGQRSSRL